MNRFIRHMAVFLVLASVVFGLTYLLNQSLFKSQPFLLEKDTKILMTGASRAAFALNPVLIPNSENIGMPELSYVQHYHILKHIVQNNSNVNHLILGFSPTHISGLVDYRFVRKGINTKNLYDIIYPVMGLKELAPFPVRFKWFLKGFLRNRVVPNFVYLKNYFSSPEKRMVPFIGGYKNICKSVVTDDVVNDRLQRHFNLRGKGVPVSTIDIQYLDSIALFTAQKGIHLTLLNTPLHEKYRNGIPDHLRKAYNERVGQLVKDYGHVDNWDFSDWIYPDSYYIDGDHLNAEGASVFSARIGELLEQPNLKRSRK